MAVPPVSDAHDVDRAFAAARTAFRGWRRTTPGERQRMLLALADVREEHAGELVEAQHRSTGQPRRVIAAEEVAAGADNLRFFAGAARVLEGAAATEFLEGHTSYVRREPLGVVAQVTPWNYLLLMAVWKLGPALAAGNTVVLEPAETTPESTLVLARLAGRILPAGVLNVVLGDASTGALMAGHRTPAMVAITGSVRAGRTVAAAAAQHLTRSHRELGGKAPAVVFADADLPAAARALMDSGTFDAGQDCTAVTGVHQGDALVPEETFATVLTVQPFATEEEAVEPADGVDHASASSVRTTDLSLRSVEEYPRVEHVVHELGDRGPQPGPGVPSRPSAPSRRVP